MNKVYTWDEIVVEWTKTHRDCNYIISNERYDYQGKPITTPFPIYGPRYISESPNLKNYKFIKVEL